MNRQHFLRLFVMVFVMSCIVLSDAFVTWAFTAKIVEYAGEVYVNGQNVNDDSRLMVLNPNYTFETRNGVAVIEYSRLKNDCRDPGTYGAVILGAGKTHTVQNALDASCTPADAREMESEIYQARTKRGYEGKDHISQSRKV